MTTKKVRVKKTVFEDRYLNTIAINQLKQAHNEEDGYKFRWLVPAMAFSVFRVEALCNIYGSQLFPHWTHFESTSFIGKIAMISEYLDVEVDFSKEPWQTLNRMKTFRNTLAHAKPQKISEVHEVPENLPDNAVPYPEEKKTIMSFSSFENAENFGRVATELDGMWMFHAEKKGFEVDTTGAPEYETISQQST